MGLKKPLSDATKKALLKKASESEFTFAQLAHVYRRGRDAYLSGRLEEQLLANPSSPIDGVISNN